MDLALLLNPEPEDADQLQQTGDDAGQNSEPEDADQLQRTENEARQILQLLRCSQCQNFLHEPVTLACGNTYCRACLTNSASNLPLVTSPDRRFTCPSCVVCQRSPHMLNNLRNDVILLQIVELCWGELDSFIPALILHRRTSQTTSQRNAETRYDDDDAGTFMSESSGEWNDRNEIVVRKPLRDLVITAERVRRLKQLMLREVECQVCTEILIDPITTPCGHTYCKRCITRTLDHSDRCPLCRRQLSNFVFFHNHPLNKTIRDFIETLYPDVQAERRAAIETELYGNMQDTALFVCQLIFPKMPCFLHVHEAHYRLMLRRCLDSRQRRFGMVLPKPNGQGGYCEYGTMLEIRSTEFLPDGRSLVETVGSCRFRVISSQMRDGYYVGKIERVDDVDSEEEEELERRDVAYARANNMDPNNPRIEEYTTTELIAIAREFIESLRNGSTPWLLQRLNSTYGEMPDDSSDFSFWVATVIPIDEYEKYKLLALRSVRERLKLVVGWITQLQKQWWFTHGCSIS